MRVARYWARGSVTVKTPDGQDAHRTIWRGSDESEHDAKIRLDRALAETAQRLRMGREPRGGWYEYAESTRPEPLVEEITGDDGARLAAVTINRYGATVLNVARVPIIDVDAPQPKAQGALSRLFGRKAQPPDPRREVIARLEDWVAQRGDRAARVYRTAAGLRYILPATEMDPDGQDAAALMQHLGADERYARLCRVQQCYRARLSPKPWRIGVRSPAGVKHGCDADALARWNERYQAACERFAVCELVSSLGSGASTPAGARIADFHDAATRVGASLPLA